MRFMAVAALGVVLGCGAWGAEAAQPAKQTPAEIAAGIAAHPPADLNAYYALKEQLGADGVMAVTDEASQIARVQAGIGKDVHQMAACRLPDWYLTAYAGLSLARTVPDAASWKADVAQLTQALAARDAVHKRVRDGEAADPLFNWSAALFRESQSAGSARARALAERVGEDQFARLSSQVVQSKSLWASGLDPAVEQYLMDLGNAESCSVDRANLEWLKADLSANGWPRISQNGAQMDAEAWVLVQHADQDPVFQKEVLGMLEALLPAKDTTLQNYAMLYDRVAVAEKRPQRYGSQGRCTGEAKWEPFPAEDPARLDALRAEAGLQPEADYMKTFTYCTAAIAALESQVQ